MNCHGCKWLDETQPQGAGYCCTVQRSKDYHTMPCIIDCGHRAPEIRRPELPRCELFEPGALMLKWDSDSPVSFKPDGRTVHDYDERFQLEDEGLIRPGDRFLWSMLEDRED